MEDNVAKDINHPPHGMDLGLIDLEEIKILSYEIGRAGGVDPMKDQDMIEEFQVGIKFALMLTVFEPEWDAGIGQKMIGENINNEEWMEGGHDYCRDLFLSGRIHKFSLI